MDEMAALVELDQRLLIRELLPDLLEVGDRGGRRDRADVDVRLREPQAGGRHPDQAQDAQDDDADDDPDPGLDFASHPSVSLHLTIDFACSTQSGSAPCWQTAAACGSLALSGRRGRPRSTARRASSRCARP